jgi:hypothetical protein
MAIRADWHEGVAAEDGPQIDPFASASSLAMTHAPLSIDFTTDQLRERIVKLFKREKYLFDRMGLSCPIKDRCDTTCLACPLNEANTETVKGRLCRTGVEQEQAETLLAVKLTHGV